MEKLIQRKEYEYVDELELNQQVMKPVKRTFKYENEKTDHGVSILVSEIKKGEYVNLYDRPCKVIDIHTSKKAIWIIGRDVESGKECDVVFEKHELIEKYTTTIHDAKITSNTNSVYTMQIDKDKEFELKFNEYEESIREIVDKRLVDKENVSAKVLEINNQLKVLQID